MFKPTTTSVLCVCKYTYSRTQLIDLCFEWFDLPFCGAPKPPKYGLEDEISYVSFREGTPPET